MKVLLTSVSAGSGHVRAAEAVQAAFWRRRPDVKAVHIDALDFVAPTFQRMYRDGYSYAVNHTPAFWGRLYSFLDQPHQEGGIVTWINRVQRYYAPALFRYLSRVQPDLILTTHFLIPQLLRQDQAFPWVRRIPLECVITDYDLHQFWVNDNISRYYVAHEGLADRLAAEGVPSSRIVVSGIPVHPVFLMPVSKTQICRNLALDPAKPILLVLAGGLGLSVLEKTVRCLFRLERPVQIVTVAGRNEALRRRLNHLTPPPHMTLVSQGCVRNMHELLTISDLVLTKPGGLTMSECLAKSKPMLICSPIPGQEERNAAYAFRRQIALRAGGSADVPLCVDRFLNDASLRERLHANLAACAKPSAAFQIAETAVQSFAVTA